MKAVVIIPTYNEKGNIEQLIRILEEEVFPKIKNHDMHILVADDNSPDGTADTVRTLMEKWKNLDISVGEKQGLGAAYIRAMTYAIGKGADVVFEIDADLQHDPQKVPEFLEKIDEGYDMVIGTRYSQGGSIPSSWPIQRKIFSVFGNLLVRTILLKFSIHDWTGGYRAIKKEVFLKEKPELTNFKGYTFQVSFLNKVVRDGYKVAEVPFHFGDRNIGNSKIAPMAYIVDLLKYVITASIKEKLFGSFGKFLVVGGTGFVIQLVIYRLSISAFSSTPLGILNWIAAQPAIFSNYNLNNLWTFRTEKIKSPGAYLTKMLGFFLTSNIGVLIIQSGIIQLLQIIFGRAGILPYIYFVFATGVLLIYNFTVYRLIIWRKKPSK
jgi:dolichol-phosphate mannosyltransferase